MPYEMLDSAPTGRYEMLPRESGSQSKTSSFFDDLKQGAGNTVAGAVRGAGSIGATLLTPVDAAARALGVENSFIGRSDRRTAMDSSLQGMGAQPDSLIYQGSKLSAEIAGTAGAGGFLAKPLQALAASRFGAGIEPLINGAAQALQTGGFRVGQLAGTGAGAASRVAGGAASGASAAGLINPEDAMSGALIGGALPGAIKIVGMGGDLIKAGTASLTKNTLGMMSGVGGESVGTAYQSGKSGGTNFLDNMRGNVPMTDVLDSAKGALSRMRIDRGNQYRSGMTNISADKSVIDFLPIDNAVASLQSMGSYKGQTINKNAAGTVDEIVAKVKEWKALDPKEFHTPEGLDALKQSISDIRDSTQFGTAGRRAADTAYNAVKGEIVQQAPTYAKVMKDYSQASETLNEIQRALSLNPNASIDTSMRKLQSLMRNNVNTNYGNRLSLAKQLEQNGADILPGIAGQAMSSLTPRGLQGLSASGLAGAGLMTSNPMALGLLPLTSPRLVGEAAYGFGLLNRGMDKVGRASMQGMQGLLGGSNTSQLTLDGLLPLLATTPILAANQR